MLTMHILLLKRTNFKYKSVVLKFGYIDYSGINANWVKNSLISTIF